MNPLSNNLQNLQRMRSAAEVPGNMENTAVPGTREGTFSTLYQNELKERYTPTKSQTREPARQEMLQAFSRTWDLNVLKAMNGRAAAPTPMGEEKPATHTSPGSKEEPGNDIADMTGLSGENIIDRFKKSSNFSYEHSLRVGDLAGRLADKLHPGAGGDSTAKNNVESYYNDLGKFHDIGKYTIPFEILEKPDKLTAEEFGVVKNHPVAGENMLKQNSEFNDLLPAVRHHHERWDGNGYPDGLKGEQIPLEARIISVVDSYDAITSDRPYRKGASPGNALEELKRCAGTQFDPSIVKTFSAMVGEMEGIGR
jgi:HD-GYP domain-containing protein (c-di-GMP phosphodiesterase class II)